MDAVINDDDINKLAVADCNDAVTCCNVVNLVSIVPLHAFADDVYRFKFVIDISTLAV